MQPTDLMPIILWIQEGEDVTELVQYSDKVPTIGSLLILEKNVFDVVDYKEDKKGMFVVVCKKHSEMIH